MLNNWYYSQKAFECDGCHKQHRLGKKYTYLEFGMKYCTKCAAKEKVSYFHFKLIRLRKRIQFVIENTTRPSRLLIMWRLSGKAVL